MITVDSAILNKSPEEIILPIEQFLLNAWNIPSCFSCLSTARYPGNALRSFLFDIHVQGWSAGIDEYSKTTCEFLSQELDKLAGSPSYAQMGFFDSSRLKASTDLVNMQDARKKSVLLKIMSDINNRMMVSARRPNGHANSKSFAQSMIRQYSYIDSIRPINFEKSFDLVDSGITIKDQLIMENNRHFIAGYSGYDVKMREFASLPILLSAPVIAWEFHYNSRSIVDQLIDAVFQYSFELRKLYNHFSVRAAINRDDFLDSDTYSL